MDLILDLKFFGRIIRGAWVWEELSQEANIVCFVYTLHNGEREMDAPCCMIMAVDMYQGGFSQSVHIPCTSHSSHHRPTMSLSGRDLGAVENHVLCRP